MLGSLFCALAKAFGACDKKELEGVIHILQKNNAELQKQLPEPIIPVTDLVWITRTDYLVELAKVGIKPIDWGTPLDISLSLTSKAELDRIAPFLVQPADEYIAEIRDCEDYGIEAQSRASKYRVSSVRLGLGNMPLGYHGFAVTMDKEFNIWWLEPNSGFEYAGVWYKIGDNGYSPDKVFV